MNVTSGTRTVMEKDDFVTENRLYADNVCLESSFYYQFIIKDSYRDGLLSPGSYRVEYDDQVINVGRHFEYKEESTVFGNSIACAS